MKTIGMIGIGLMGHGIASNILQHGYPLGMLEHPGNQPLEDLIQRGAITYQSASRLAAASDVVLLCVTGSPQVEAVLLSPDGVLEGLRPGTLVIDCSTAIPTSTEKIAQAVQARGGQFIDAAMTRTPKEAAEGRLNLLVGGAPEVFEQAHPLLSCFAENITHAGPVGAGHRMKLLHNYVSLGTVALIAEAAACAMRSKVDPAIFVEVLAKGGGGGVALDRLKPYLLAQDPSSLRFAMTNAQKDLGYYTNMAEQTGAVCTIGRAVRDTFDQAVAEDAQRLVPELVQLLAQRPTH